MLVVKMGGIHRGCITLVALALFCCIWMICGKMSLAVTSGASACADTGRSLCESMLDGTKERQLRRNTT